MSLEWTNSRDHMVAIIRKLAYRADGCSVGVAQCAAALLGVVGPARAHEILSYSGMSFAPGLFKAIPSASRLDLEQLPGARLDPDVTRLVNSSLKPFMQGEAGAEEALVSLLEASGHDSALRRFLEDPQSLPGAVPPLLTSTRSLLREMARYMQPRLAHGTRCIENGWDLPTGAMDELIELERASLERLFAQRLFQKSPVGKYWQALGHEAGCVLVASLLGEMGLLGQGWPTVGQMAAILDPKYQHRVLKRALDTVRELRQRRLVAVLPATRFLTLHHQVVPGRRFLDRFLDYLLIEPISYEEEVDLLKRMV